MIEIRIPEYPITEIKWKPENPKPRGKMKSICRSGFRLLSAVETSPAISVLRLYSSSSATEELEMIDQRRLPTDYDPSNFDPTEHRSPPTPRVFQLVDEISNLTLSEISDLSSILKRKLGMKESPTIAVMKAGTVGVGVVGGKAKKKEKEAEVEKTVFELKLESFEPAGKLKVIKEVRAITDLGLKEAKALVEKAPTIFKNGLSKEEAQQIAEKMNAVGAKVILV